MAPVVCHICGRQFGTASLNIHVVKCEQKWNHEQSKLPAKQRRPCPMRPDVDLNRLSSGGNTKSRSSNDLRQRVDEYNQAAFAQFNEAALYACTNCRRTFNAKSLEVHQRSCKVALDESKIPAWRREKRPEDEKKIEKTPEEQDAKDERSTRDELTFDDLIDFVEQNRSIFSDNSSNIRSTMQYIASLKR